VLYFLSAATGYILGSINFGIILTKLMYKKDIRNMGSGNAGATNALRNFGVFFAILVFFCDMLKGLAAVYLTRLFANGDRTLFLLAGVFAVIGHLYPIFFKFKGGKGVATTSGVMIASAPVLAPYLFGLFIVISIATRYISLASICSVILYPILVYFICGRSIEQTVFAAILAVLVVFMHITNIKRLLKGTERKVSLKKNK
jgi:glycerol-3-phosphate acyltransferase PlsY